MRCKRGNDNGSSAGQTWQTDNNKSVVDPSESSYKASDDAVPITDTLPEASHDELSNCES